MTTLLGGAAGVAALSGAFAGTAGFGRWRRARAGGVLAARPHLRARPRQGERAAHSLAIILVIWSMAALEMA